MSAQTQRHLVSARCSAQAEHRFSAKWLYESLLRELPCELEQFTLTVADNGLQSSLISAQGGSEVTGRRYQRTAAGVIGTIVLLVRER